MTPEGPSHVRVDTGKLTALKGGSGQFDLTSGVHYVFKNTGVPYVQMVRFHIFTSDKNFYNNSLEIHYDCYQRELSLAAKEWSGTFSLDDEFIVDPDWSFNRYTTNQLTWWSSDTSILTIGKVTGSNPQHVYSTAKYTVHKKGKVTVSAMLGNMVVKSITFTAVPRDAAQPMTVEAKAQTVNIGAAKRKAQVVSNAIVVKGAKGKVTYSRVANGSSKNLTINGKTGKITVKKGTAKGTYKIKVRVTAAGNESLKQGSKTVTVKITVGKTKQPLTVKAKTKAVKAVAAKRKAQFVSNAIVVKGAKGKVTYSRVANGSSKNLTINGKTGKITVKKGTAKGTYKIKVRVTAAGKESYTKTSKMVTVKIRVK